MAPKTGSLPCKIVACDLPRLSTSVYFSEFGTFSNTLFAVRFSVNKMKAKVTLVSLLVACLTRLSEADVDKDVTADFITKLADIGVTKETGKDLAAPSNVDCKKDNFQLDHPYIVKCGSDVDGAMKDWMASAQTVQYPGATAPMSKCKENKPENAFLLLASKTTQMKCFQHAGTQPPPTTGSSGKLALFLTLGIQHLIWLDHSHNIPPSLVFRKPIAPVMVNIQ